METSFAFPMIRLVVRFCMILTLASCLYVIFFFYSKDKQGSMSGDDSRNSVINSGIISSPVFDVKPYDPSADTQVRDIFSMDATDGTATAVENTPKGQLPDHLKVVGILIANPSQIIIEDSSVNRTYFIDENNPQIGIKIVRVNKDQITINYQGQEIIIPVVKN